MSELDPQIAAATAYENLFVPALFADWTARIADAAHVQEEQHVLDVACGTGALTRLLATRVGPNGRVVGLDIARGMVAVARRIVPAAEFHEGRAEALPFADRSFDAVTSQFGLMFFTDRVAALREMVRVVRPGGRLAVAVWASLDENAPYADEARLIERIAGTRAADPVRAPFQLGDRDALARVATEAGIVEIDVALHEGSARFPDIRTFVEADLRGWLPLMGVVLAEPQIAQILADAEAVLARYVVDGVLRFTTRALLLRGRRPA